MPDENDIVIPDGWKLTTLGELGRYLNGRGFKTSEWSRRGRPIIRIQDLTGSSRNPNYFEGQVEDRHVVRPGDFLISWSATLGAYIWDGPEAVLNQHIFKVESNIDRRFHYHLVRDRIAELERNAHGSGMVHVTKGVFENTPVAIPPDEETQQRLAKLIDVGERSRQSAATHLASARKTIERFNHAVLAAACSGRLTADWRADAEVDSADVALERKRLADRERLGRKYREPLLPDISTLPQIPDEWCWAALPELGELGRGKSKHRPRNDPKLYGDGYPFIQTGDVARSGGWITSHFQTYNELGLAQSRLWPEKTVCITIAANIAESALLAYPACFPDSVAGLIADEDIALPEYVELFIRTARADLAAFAPATAQSNINLAILSELAVPLPPIEEQREVVRRVSSMFDLADRLSGRIETGSRQIDRSSQAILAKAFRGELMGVKT
jgi:type I restriction enzyme S subunit